MKGRVRSLTALNSDSWETTLLPPLHMGLLVLTLLPLLSAAATAPSHQDIGSASIDVRPQGTQGLR